MNALHIVRRDCLGKLLWSLYTNPMSCLLWLEWLSSVLQILILSLRYSQIFLSCTLINWDNI